MRRFRWLIAMALLATCPLVALSQNTLTTAPINSVERYALNPTREMLDHGENVATTACASCHGADGVAVSNAALQAIGCLGMRACHTNNCPSGVATQRPELRKRLDVEQGAQRLARFFDASTRLMQVMARACGHARLADFNPTDLTTWKRDMARLSGVRYGGLLDA